MGATPLLPGRFEDRLRNLAPHAHPRGRIACRDNGAEFIFRAMDRFAYEHGVALDCSRRGKPTDNPFIEFFNGSPRDEYLNAHWFLSHRRCPGKD
jgi:transposase InsO family protein